MSFTMCFISRNHLSHPALLLLFSCISLYLNLDLSVAVDSIFPGRSLSGEQTIISSNGKFELGFFSPGNSHNYYLGIWFKKITPKNVIWVANRERPIPGISSSELKISLDGNLVFLDPSKVTVWSSNSSSLASNSTVAVLLDTGNLVLKGGLNSSVIWQSFDHLTDTWMPEGWLGRDKITGETYYLTSWKNMEDPAPGPFSYVIDKGNSSEYFLMWNGSVKYWSSGVWVGYFPSMPEVKASNKFRFDFVETEQKKYYTYTVLSDSIISRATLDVNGQMKLWVWASNSQQWTLVWARPTSECAAPALCGAYGVCDDKSFLFCSCLQGFEPVSSRDWALQDRSRGCHRLTPLQCSNNTNSKKDIFDVIPNVRLPQNSLSLVAGSKEECASTCLNNCNCTAYAYQTGNGCSIWSGELLNVERLYDDDINAQTLYLRLTEPPSPSKKNLVTGIAVGVALGITIFCIALGITWRHGRRFEIKVDGSLLLFTYKDLKRITNFSEKLGGGGFGSVYKGSLPDCTVVAVKRLEGVWQGHKQFRTEVITLGTIHHVNLICLRGFCVEDTKRLLVYEYMPNGSLDSHLFSKTSKTLNWSTRYQIILGIARGLAYLHEKCRECIIHCDIKPENILLDAEFCPKVADFGLAKLLGRDFSRVLTTMRGTIGYLAPEWISGLAITPKADVYSFGMMVFEIVSGRRNLDGSRDQSAGFLPIQGAIQVNKGEVLELLDPKLDGAVDMEELKRVCRIACWCIQDSETQRLSMGQVVQILEGSLEVNTPPIPRTLQNLAKDQG